MPVPGLATDKAEGARTDTIPILGHGLVEHSTASFHLGDLELINFKNLSLSGCPLRKK